MKLFTKNNGIKPSRTAQRHLQLPFDLVRPHLQAVEQQIKNQASAFDPQVESYVAYACQSSGKRLRPALALLTGGATGGIKPGHSDLAVILELIHLASLVHDDIIDGASLRREQPTANAKWGNSVSVLLGDCLFAHALRLATNFEESHLCRRIATVTAELCSGEIMQTQRRFDLHLSRADYYRIIEMKTASLFFLATELGAFLNHRSPEETEHFLQYGRKLGIAYQIYDDCIDIAGDEEAIGKTLGTDLLKGKITLPVLMLLEKLDDRRHTEICRILLHGAPADIALIPELVREKGCLAATVDTARQFVREAQDHLHSAAPDSDYRRGMVNIGEALLETLDSLK